MSGRNDRFRLRLDDDLYSTFHRFVTYCYAPDGRTVRGGYVVRGQHLVGVNRDAWIDDTLAYRATRISGELTVEWSLTRTGRARGCRDDYVRYKLSGVRER